MASMPPSSRIPFHLLLPFFLLFLFFKVLKKSPEWLLSCVSFCLSIVSDDTPMTSLSHCLKAAMFILLICSSSLRCFAFSSSICHLSIYPFYPFIIQVIILIMIHVYTFSLRVRPQPTCAQSTSSLELQNLGREF